MEIGNYNSSILSTGLKNQAKETTTSKNRADFTINEKEKTAKTGDVVAYYMEFTSQFKNVSFRMTDSHDTGEGKAGYNGKVHETRSGFGNTGVVSIQLDVHVLKKMQEDEEYEELMVDKIYETIEFYQEFRSRHAAEGYPYVFAFFVENEEGYCASATPINSANEMEKMAAETKLKEMSQMNMLNKLILLNTNKNLDVEDALFNKGKNSKLREKLLKEDIYENEKY